MTPRRTAGRAALLPLLLLLLLAAGACGRAADEGRIDPDALDAALAEGRLLLDVRTPEEYAAGHVPDATLIPLQELEGRLDEIAAWRERGVVAYCERGGRAEQAAQRLREAGFEDVVLLDGSMRRWRDEGRAVATGDGEAG
jgi:rhodanese-related sulfurtransferase